MFLDEVITHGLVATVVIKDIPKDMDWDDIEKFLDSEYGSSNYFDYFVEGGTGQFKFER